MRVLLATDRPSLGAALSMFLAERRVEVVGVVARAEDVAARAASSRADVVVVDWHLAAAKALVAELTAPLDHPPVVVLGSSQQGDLAHGCGADAFAVVGDPPDALLAAMREVTAGRA